MKNFKGGSKQFSKYLDSEYNDDYLEAFSDEDDYHKDSFIPQKKQEASKNQANNTQKKTQKKAQENNQNQETSMTTPLTYQYIKEFVALLGADAKNCYYNLKEIKSLKNELIIDTYKDFYTKFETVPMLFLSLIDKEKTNAVYLWQMNRKCPHQKGTNKIILDSRTAATNLKSHPSMLLLAKITPEDKEQILDATFLSENKLIVKSISAFTNTMIWRLYKINHFYPVAKINPYNQITVANDKFSYELRLDILKQKDVDSGEEINPLIRFELFKTKVDEEQVIDFTKIDQQKEKTKKKELIDMREILSQDLSFEIRDLSFSQNIQYPEEGRIVFLDNNTGSVLSWREAYFQFSHFPEAANFNTMYKYNDKIYLVNEKQYNVFELSIHHAEISLEKVDIKVDPFPVVENITKQPRKMYDLLPGINFPQILYVNKSEIHSSFFRKYRDFDSKLVIGFEEKLKKSKTFNWSLCMGNNQHSYFLVCIFNQYMDIYSILSGDLSEIFQHKVIQLSADAKEYDIIASSHGKIYLSRDLHGGALQLIEVNYDDSNDILFDQDYKPEIKEIQKSGQPFKKGLEEEYYSQLNEDKGISFIRFDNEPFYVDTVNLMYDTPLSLVNPLDFEISQGKINKEIMNNDSKEQDNKLLKKLAKTKVVVSHSNNRESAMEESKEALKELRADIGSKMKNIKKFDDEYKILEREKGKEKKNIGDQNQEKDKGKLLKEPVGVSKESIKLYQDIKAEKKKLDKQRDKEKTQRKKDRERD